jgi:hypothetical protein
VVVVAGAAVDVVAGKVELVAGVTPVVSPPTPSPQAARIRPRMVARTRRRRVSTLCLIPTS